MSFRNRDPDIAAYIERSRRQGQQPTQRTPQTDQTPHSPRYARESPGQRYGSGVSSGSGPAYGSYAPRSRGPGNLPAIVSGATSIRSAAAAYQHQQASQLTTPPSVEMMSKDRLRPITNQMSRSNRSDEIIYESPSSSPRHPASRQTSKATPPNPAPSQAPTSTTPHQPSRQMSRQESAGASHTSSDRDKDAVTCTGNCTGKVCGKCITFTTAGMAFCAASGTLMGQCCRAGGSVCCRCDCDDCD